MDFQVKRYLNALIHDAGFCELVRIDGHRIEAGLFSEPELIWASVSGPGNFYTTVNAPTPRTVCNGLTGLERLSDADIGWRTRLFFDFDAVRATDRPASRTELREAHKARKRLLTWLRALEWPEPLLAMSGNGFHAQYRVKLPNNSDTGSMLRDLYRGLAEEFSTEGARFDATVRNASRLCRLYGTVNRKGTPSNERPHRRAKCVVPDVWQVVPPSAIESVAQRLAPKVKTRGTEQQRRQRVEGSGDYSTLDVVAWFQGHGCYKRELEPGKHAVVCPWSDEHSMASHSMATDTVVWEPSAASWPTFHCSHDHCDGRSIVDVLDLWGDADEFCSRGWRKNA